MQKGFRKYLVWQKAHQLAVESYKATKKFPPEERYGLTSQVRRAAFSVPTNFVEGYARNSTKQFLHFLNISQGSLAEFEYLIEFAKDVEILSEEDFGRLESLRKEVGLLLNRFTSAIQRNSRSSDPS